MGQGFPDLAGNDRLYFWRAQRQRFHSSKDNGRYDRSPAGRIQPDKKICQARRQDAERNRNQEKRGGNSLGASGQSGAGGKERMKEITAKLNNYRASPRKTRIVAGLIKGKNARDAVVQLDFLTKKSASPIAKLLKSAISNAKNDFKTADEKNLTVKTVTVNAGTVLKRSRPRSRGTANQILKRTSNITIVLEDKSQNKK